MAVAFTLRMKYRFDSVVVESLCRLAGGLICFDRYIYDNKQGGLGLEFCRLSLINSGRIRILMNLLSHVE